MKQTKPEVKVLFIGENLGSFSHIAGRLENGGCQCQFAKSYEEARQFINNEGFDLVLSVALPRDNAIASITSLLAGSPASFFYALPVEESCWWLPAIRQGKRCFGAPALRPSEFAALLDQVITEFQEARSLDRNTPAAPAKSPAGKDRPGAVPSEPLPKTNP